MPRRYAQDTTVPVSKSRAEIDKLLRDWGADGVQWSDHFSESRVVLRFTWKGLTARFDVELESEASLRGKALNQKTGQVSDVKLQKLLDGRGRHEHRLLLLWIKAALNACEAGMVAPEAIFLPFFEGKDGHTVAEVAVPKLPMLIETNAARLLGAGR